MPLWSTLMHCSSTTCSGCCRAPYNTMRQLAEADSVRFRLGSITETDARQSRLEAGILLNSLLQGAADWKTALVQLSLNVGRIQADTFLIPGDNLSDMQRNFSLVQLVLDAQSNRADVIAAENRKTFAGRTLHLARANRSIDLGSYRGNTVQRCFYQ